MKDEKGLGHRRVLFHPYLLLFTRVFRYGFGTSYFSTVFSSVSAYK